MKISIIKLHDLFISFDKHLLINYQTHFVSFNSFRKYYHSIRYPYQPAVMTHVKLYSSHSDDNVPISTINSKNYRYMASDHF